MTAAAPMYALRRRVHDVLDGGREDGNAILEFCFLAVLFMVPLVYVLLAVFRVQNASYAVSAATREAGRAYVTSERVADAPSRAVDAAAIAMRDHGLALTRRQLRVTCSQPGCLIPGGSVTTTVIYQVSLPFTPRFLGRMPASVSVTATHLELVDRFRAVG